MLIKQFIQDVKLLNYTNDLDWKWEPKMDPSGTYFVEDPEEGFYFTGAGLLTVNDNDPKDILKAKGKYTLKFAVTYADAAGNEKAAQVSYKLNIVR